MPNDLACISNILLDSISSYALSGRGSMKAVIECLETTIVFSVAKVQP